MSDIPYLLRFRPFNESSIFKFPDPDSGRIHVASDRPSLIKVIVTYRAQNGYPEIENLNLVLDHYLCSLPENSGKCAPYQTLKRGFKATLKGGIALVTSLLYKTFATQEEADRRSSICKDCKYNIFPDKGYFVKWSDELAAASVGKRKSKFHENLGNCEVCSCCLKAKVFYNGKVDLTPEQIIQMKEVNCWQPDLVNIQKD